MSIIKTTNNIYGSGHVEPLTGLRAIGALWVIAYHFHTDVNYFFQPIIQAGGAFGLSIFFCLSGYIMTHVYKDQDITSLKGAYNFIVKRIARVYPLHVFLLFVLILTYPKFVNVTTSDTFSFFTNLLMIHGWGFHRFSWIAASWSISVEFILYLFFPLLFFLKYKYFSITVLIVLTLISFVFYWDYRQYFLTPDVVRDYGITGYGHLIIRYGALFVLGVATYYTATNFALARRILDNNITFVVLGIAIIGITFLNHRDRLDYVVLLTPIFIRSVHICSLSKILLGNRTMVFLGELSYSIYLSHQLIHRIVTKTTKVEISPIIEWGATYLTLFIWCIFCYYVIEKPARTRLRSLIKT